MSSKILIINGSPSGNKGNCARWIRQIQKEHKNFEWNVIHLADQKYSTRLKAKMKETEAYIFVTGTYWDSWGSPLQKFLEEATELEGTEFFLGKPAAVLVLMHSVGGKAVLSRLQGVLNTLGCLIPPMAGMVYSLASDLALRSQSSHAADFWAKKDVESILKNVERCLELKTQWTTWPVDRKNPRRLWLR